MLSTKITQAYEPTFNILDTDGKDFPEDVGQAVKAHIVISLFSSGKNYIKPCTSETKYCSTPLQQKLRLNPITKKRLEDRKQIVIDIEKNQNMKKCPFKRPKKAKF